MTGPDSYVRDLCRRNPHLLVPHFLMHSYLYYVLDTPIVSDDTFDWLVKELGTRWEQIEHCHKHLIDRSLLKTGFYLSYPEIVKGAAGALVARFMLPGPKRHRRPKA